MKGPIQSSPGVSPVFQRLFAIALMLVATLGSALADSLSWVGNTTLYETGVGALPNRGAFIEPYQTLTVTTQTYPISNGQAVNLIYTTDNWSTSHTVPFTYDFITGNNSQWYTVLGPLPKGSDVQFYIQASIASPATNVYDNNSSQNFGYLSRYYPTARRGAILQWFATDYKTMMARLPEVVQAGYGSIYIPPPMKAGGGTYSVGYNPYDRFDLGSRYQLGTVRTQYGTAQELQSLLNFAHRLGLEVYADLVYNHNDNRASVPINAYPGMIPEDFHIKSSADTSNPEIDFNNAPAFSVNLLDHDMYGLTDIAHEDGNATQTGAFTLPSYATMNAFTKPSFIRDPQTVSLYPNHTPVAEDVRQYLLRWNWWLTTQLGFDGYRLDAVKHMPASFFGFYQTQPGPFGSVGNLIPTMYSLNPNTFVFGEVYDTNNYEFREYLKSGMNMVDFPLFSNLNNVLNSHGYGSLSNSFTNGFGLDPSTGLPFELGGLATDTGVAIMQSHDNGPPEANNLGYAFILTRPGSAIVYYDGNNQIPGDYTQFPKPGRYDALGAGDDYLLRLVDARNRFARGTNTNLYRSDNLDIYERDVNHEGVLLVGLNIRGDMTALTQTVPTFFDPGTVLTDLSGQQPDVTVAANGTATITVPANSDANTTNNARGYVIYAPKAPSALNGIEPVTLQTSSGVLPFSTYASATPAHGPPGSYRAVSSTTGKLNMRIHVDASATSAAVRVDTGVAIPGHTLLTNTSEGLSDGCFLASGSAGNFLTGLDMSGLADGLHVIRVRTFTDAGTGPGIFKDFYVFVYLSQSGLASVNGDLSKYGSFVSTQTRTPSSSSNRLDGLVITNDDQYLYVGLAGNVDASEGLLNGIAMYLDTDPGAGTGVRNFATIHDDSGPATRLLSNATVIAPFGFGAEFGLSSFRGSTLSSSPEAPFTGSPVSPWTVGPQAGLFQIDTGHLSWMLGVPAAIAWKPRPANSGPSLGLEAAIPLKSLYSSVSSGAQIGLIAFLDTTGETGQVYTSTDPNRALYGNRPPAHPYVLNQFLPPQSGVVNDPGTSSTGLQSSYNYSLTFANTITSLMVLPGPVLEGQSGNPPASVRLFNPSPMTVAGPIYLIVHLNNPNAILTNATGISLRSANTAYIKLAGPIKARDTIPVPLTFQVTSGSVNPTFEVERGVGIP